jgi:ArsR family transcriptional regulator
MLSLFARRAERLDGIDLSHRMLTLARANLDQAAVTHSHLRQGDATNLPYADASADLVIIHQVLHFIDEPDRVLAEAGRVLSETGRLLVVDFAPHNLEFLRAKHGHRRLGIRHEALSEWCQSAGLCVRPPKLFEQPEEVDDGLTVQVWAADKQAVKTSRNERLSA